jgi:MoaA/NifB/PqqE/SkfB family radical SAM enzyme/SAM-dependent methyltransferase
MMKGRDREFSRARIRVSYRCGQDCVFCDCRPRRKLSDASLKQLARKIMLARERGFKMVVFTGGEPTGHPDFLKLCALCHKIGLPVGLASNGVALSDPSLVKRLIGLGLRFVQLSIHGDSDAVHAALSGAPVEPVFQALANLRKTGIEVVCNTVLARPNADRLAAIAARIAAVDAPPGAPAAVHKVTWMNPATLDPDLREPIILPLDEARKAIAALYIYCDNQPGLTKRVNVVVAGLPLCALRGYEDRSYDLRRDGLAEESELLDAAFVRDPHSGRIKPAPCADCRFNAECPGIWEAYADWRGTDELAPEKRPVSNSFGYEPLEDWPDFDVAACPILAGERTLSEPERLLLVAQDTGVRLVRTDSADFDAAQLLRTKHDLGQLYLDISGRLFHEDFSTDMRKLDLHPVCAACPKRRDCATVQVARDTGNVFISAEAELIEVLRGLSGRVLDVGGGPLRYGDLFGSLVDNGTISYFVVEPDINPVLSDFLRNHRLTDRIFAGRIEDYDAEPDSLDWILVLRSHNHLYDLELAYRNMAGWLKPGGRLLLVDNTVYGVVRSREVWDQIAREGGAVRFEHFNNHTSTEAIPIVSAAGLKLIEDHPVTPQSANQWWCVFEKPGS